MTLNATLEADDDQSAIVFVYICIIIKLLGSERQERQYSLTPSPVMTGEAMFNSSFLHLLSDILISQ